MNISATRVHRHFETMGETGKISSTGTCRPTMKALEKALLTKLQHR